MEAVATSAVRLQYLSPICGRRLPRSPRGQVGQTRRRLGRGNSGQPFISCGAMATRRGRPRHPDLLTPSEARVLDLIREGLPNAEIAANLGVSVNTVRFHVSNLLAKSGVADRVSLGDWEPGPGDLPRRGLPGFGLPLLRPLGLAAGGAGATAAVVLGVIAMAGRGEEPAAPADTPPAYPAAVVGMLTRQPGGLVVTEPGGSSFRLTSELTFGRWVGSQMFILGEVDGDTLSPVAGSPVGAHSRCAGVLSESGGKLSVGGGCRGMELTGVPIERVLALRSEKVTVTVIACTASRDGRLESPPIDAFGEERTHTCSTPPAGGPNGTQ